MSNFTVNFTIPWLLLLLIPAIVFTLIPYFRLAKRYRRTRNRISSIVLHILIMVMCITVLSGMTFSYDIPNEDNEVVIVVDMSYSRVESYESAEDAHLQKDAFVRSVLEEGASLYKVGIVAFGYKPHTVVEPTLNGDEVIEKYFEFRDHEYLAEVNGEEPKYIDDSASDISAALDHAANLLTNRQGSKIVLVSDGIETDGNALATVKRLAADGIKIDTVSFTKEADPEVEIIDVKMPEVNLGVGDEAKITLTLNSSVSGAAKILIVDEDSSDTEPQDVTPDDFVLKDDGVQEVEVSFSFNNLGMHRLKFIIEHGQDTLKQNNEYHSYIYLEAYDKILMLEGFAGEANAIKDVLLGSGAYDEEDIKVVNINPTDGNFPEVPQTIDELRAYDQVILVNVANSDLINWSEDDLPPASKEDIKNMPKNFDKMLSDYVSVHGGGVFVVGGDEKDASALEPEAHAFDRLDLNAPNAAIFRNMLPVEAVKYTPPVAVMLLIDRSGSMAETIVANDTKTKLDYAKEAARECINSLTYRDFLGVMTLDSTYDVVNSIVSVQNRPALEANIDSITAGGGTLFANALDRAGQALLSLSNKQVSKRHVILITDGEPQEGLDTYGAIIRGYHSEEEDDPNSITFSIINIAGSQSDSSSMQTAAEEYGGGRYILINSSDVSNITTTMREELSNEDIVDYDPDEEYVPSIESYASPVVDGIELDDQVPSIRGFYGTREREGASTILSAPYVPLYTQWKFGKGMVGAFMSSLNGDENSSTFIQHINGQTIINNIVSNLMPTSNIRPQDIDVDLIEENYTTKVSVSTSVAENQGVRVTATAIAEEGDPNMVPQVVELSAADGYSRATLEITKPGVHRIVVEKYRTDAVDEFGNPEVVSTTVVYKTFSYSKEYEVFVDNDAAVKFMSDLAFNGRGAVIDSAEPETIFLNFDTGIHKEFDPRTLFMILSIILFLLDIAVRKFKFKWIHELVHDYKERRKQK